MSSRPQQGFGDKKKEKKKKKPPLVVNFIFSNSLEK
jgi:hypothetical protein